MHLVSQHSKTDTLKDISEVLLVKVHPNVFPVCVWKLFYASGQARLQKMTNLALDLVAILQRSYLNKIIEFKTLILHCVLSSNKTYANTKFSKLDPI